MAEKVKFGLRNVHYATITEGTDSSGNITYTYATPKRLPGAVSLTLDPQGDRTPFYADNIMYYVSENNNGYQGDLELALVPESFYADVFGMTADDDGIISEYAGTESKAFALLFQVETDAKARCMTMFYCKASRPGVGSTTIAENKEPQTQTMNITVMPRANDNLVRSCTGATATDATRAAWFDEVVVPGQTPEPEPEEQVS